MPKNVVFLHLESLSQLAFYTNRTSMPFLWFIANRSMSFRNFNAGSTSTYPSLLDLVYGDSSEFDHNEYFPDKRGCNRGRAKNLFAELRRLGYDGTALYFASFAGRELRDNYLGVWPDECGPPRLFSEMPRFMEGVSGFFDGLDKKGAPFFLHLFGLAPHIFDSAPEKEAANGFFPRISMGHAMLDNSVKLVFDELQRRELLAGTLVVGIGDHGDDYWFHGVNKGFTHALPPYASQVHTPFFIFNNFNDVGISGILANMIDIKPTLLAMLVPEELPERSGSPFAGMNLLVQQRKYSFSQTLFALQREQQDRTGGLVQGYAVTDGIFRLVAVSGGDNPEAAGMEFYCDTLDPDNATNLLEFMTLDGAGNIRSFDSFGSVHPHFVMNMTRKNIAQLIDTFTAFRKLLRDHARAKEASARELLPEGGNSFPDAAFLRIRKRQW
jgi:hypothetical protein